MQFWLKAERQIVEAFEMLPEPIVAETLEDWLGHPLSDGLSIDEMNRLRVTLDDLRTRGRGARALRADGTPRKRKKLPPPPTMLGGKSKPRKIRRDGEA